MSLTEERREFLLAEFEAIHAFRVSFAEQRFQALGGVVTILGVVISLNSATTFPLNLGVPAMMLVIVFAGIRIVGALNRGISVFASHLKWVEEQLCERGLASYWKHFITSNVRDTGSHAYVITLRLINVCVMLYVWLVLGSAWPPDRVPRFATAVVMGLAVIFMILNEAQLRSEVDPRGFADRISRDLERARTQAFSSNQGSAHVHI